MDRRTVLRLLAGLSLNGLPTAAATDGLHKRMPPVKLFLCGDVMTGRGIDQALPHPGDPVIYEPMMRSARGYVLLAERSHGPLPRPLAFDYIWGDALAALDAAAPDARIVNLETAVTRDGEPWPGKGIQYRMHPDNLPCLAAARIDCCVLANNHVLDWGYAGLEETLASLDSAGFRHAGAGTDLEAAQSPAPLPLVAGGRVLVFAWGMESSGVPRAWAAGPGKPGVNFLPELSAASLEQVAGSVRATKAPGDLVVASIHWGGNWGYTVPASHRAFARALIDEAGVDLVHGHSSHHPLGLEVYRDHLILYGCGDLINDYEGIGGHEQFRSELSLLYLPTLDPEDGRLLALDMVPMRMQRFRLNRADESETAWLQAVLDDESRRFGTRVLAGERGLQAKW